MQYCEDINDNGICGVNNNEIGYKSKNKKDNYNQKEIENDNKNESDK